MGHKIFVSYKYHDPNVKKITSDFFHTDIVRDYVDKLEEYITEYSDNIYKGESDGEDLSKLSEDTIWEKLKNRIFDSTLTIVLVSEGMKEKYKVEKEQWIPWEISYSLKETSRKNSSGKSITSYSNAMIALVLPNLQGRYDYYLVDNNCCSAKCRSLDTNFLFKIMKKNMFNKKSPNTRVCENDSKIFSGEHSYILSVKWEDFIKEPNEYIERAFKIQSLIDEYEITKDI